MHSKAASTRIATTSSFVARQGNLSTLKLCCKMFFFKCIYLFLFPPFQCFEDHKLFNGTHPGTSCASTSQRGGSPRGLTVPTRQDAIPLEKFNHFNSSADTRHATMLSDLSLEALGIVVRFAVNAA